MRHCDRCNIVHVNLECPLCAAKATIEKIRIVVKAAPIMLEALKEIIEECPNPKLAYGMKIVSIAQAVIDVAEGKKTK